jgi:hypothetical protein
MIRLLSEDVTLLYADRIALHLRCRGGATTSCFLPKPSRSWETWTTPPEIVAEIDRLLDFHTYGEIARLLNERTLKPGRGSRFTSAIVARIQTRYRLCSRYERLRQAGLITVTEMAERLQVNPKAVKTWSRYGLLKSFRLTDKGEALYEPVDHPVEKQHGRKLRLRATSENLLPESPKRVQYAT